MKLNVIQGISRRAYTTFILETTKMIFMKNENTLYVSQVLKCFFTQKQEEKMQIGLSWGVIGDTITHQA